MKEWVAEPDYGRVSVTVSKHGVLVHVADDSVQRHISRVCSLADYGNETPPDGWVPLRTIVAEDFDPAERAEIEAYIALLRQQP